MQGPFANGGAIPRGDCPYVCIYAPLKTEIPWIPVFTGVTLKDTETHPMWGFKRPGSGTPRAR